MQGNKAFARDSARAQRKAAIETAALAIAIDKGHRTTEAIARHARQRVVDAYRRLTRSGPSMLNREFRFFTKDGDNWGLTERGRELVAACKAACKREFPTGDSHAKTQSGKTRDRKRSGDARAVARGR